MQDESHLPVSEQSLIFRLRKRAEIRRQIQDRKSVQEGRTDRIADLLEEAADELERLSKQNLFSPCKINVLQGQFSSVYSAVVPYANTCLKVVDQLVDNLVPKS